MDSLAPTNGLLKLSTLCALWCAAAGVGSWAMLNYELTPAATLPVAAHWPADSLLIRDRHRPTLLVFIHPRCPCSRASLAELNRLASRSDQRLALQIIMVRPSGLETGWERTSLFAAAERIPNATVLADPEGAEAARFGATTSGEALLYSIDGSLQFRGGLTSARGHEGDNVGCQAILAILDHEPVPLSESAVYGCPLCHPARSCKEPASCSR